MNKFEKRKKKIILAIFWFVLITSFIFFAFLIHLKANGWQLNFRTWRLLKTGMIILNGNPDKVEVKINGKIQTYSLPAKMGNLPPGSYDVSIASRGFQTWQKTIRVLPEKVSIYSDITLFLEESQEIEVPSKMTSEVIVKELQNRTNGLKVAGPEIYWNDNLVTRFSQNVVMATAYSDNHHIVFQLGNEVRVVELEGSNNQLLFRLVTSEPTTLVFRDDGRTIYYVEEGAVYGKTIR